MSILPKPFIDSMKSLSRFQWAFLQKQKKKDPKIYMEPQNSKIFANLISDKRLIFKIYEESVQLNSKRQIIEFKIG